MSGIGAIALNTLREALRARVLYLILFFALLVIFGSELISLLAVGNKQRVVEDLGLGAIQFFGVVCCIFLGISLISREIERRTVYVVLGRPVARSSLVLGKGLGLVGTVLVVTGGMALCFVVFVWLRFGEFHPALGRALIMFPFEFLLVTALALMLSSFTTPILASLLTSTLVVIGHLSHGLKLLATHPTLKEKVPTWLAMGLYYLLPNLERFNLKTEAIYRDPVPLAQMGQAAAYGLLYAACILLLTIVIVERKDFA